MKMYYAYALPSNSLITNIVEVEVAGITEKKVFFSDDRSFPRRNDATGIGYFETWEEAKQFIVECIDNKIQHLQRELYMYRRTLDRVFLMQSSDELLEVKK